MPARCGLACPGRDLVGLLPVLSGLSVTVYGLAISKLINAPVAATIRLIVALRPENCPDVEAAAQDIASPTKSGSAL